MKQKEIVEQNIVEENFYRDNPNLPSVNTKIEYTPKMVKELQKCEKDIVHFAENYFYIVNLDRGKEIIKLYPAQKKIVKSMSSDKRVVVVSSRQAGKSTLMAIFAVWFTAFKEDKTVLIISNKEKSAKDVLSRVRLGYEMLPTWLKPAVVEWQKESVVFANGSKVLISSTSSSAARGTSINCLMIDEAAHIDDFKADEFFASVLPVISSSKQSKIFMVSTPKGTNNHFYRTYSKAERKEGEWVAHKIHWKDIPGRDKAWERAAWDDVNGDKQMFDQEYCNCFLESGESAVDKELLMEFRTMVRPPDILNTPEYKVWEKPNPKAIYAIGVDVADGVGGCASCIQVFNVTDLTDIKQAACYNNRFIDTTNFSKEIFDIARQWGKPWLVIERNSMGGEVLGNLRKHPYNYERLVSYSADQEIDYEKAGVNSSTNAKYDAVSNMRYWVNILKCVKIYDIATLQELETFVKAPNGTWHKQGGENVFDDRVMAMIWSLFSLHLPVAEHIYEILQYDDKGKPLKIKRSYYDDDVDMYSVGQLKKDWGDADFVSGFISTKSDMYGANRNLELDDLMADGWKQWVQN